MITAMTTPLAAVPFGRASARVEVDALMTRLTMDVILRTLFGRVTKPARPVRRRRRSAGRRCARCSCR
jgi:cytochrome P450